MTSRIPATFEHRSGTSGCTVRVRFLGREDAADPAAVSAGYGHGIEACSYLRQVHSALVVAARRGPCGPADGLWTERQGLALSVVTADCAPVIISDGHSLAVLHAGWRGIAAGIVDAALTLLPPRSGLRAWIGPTIGPCCYEVGQAVADRLAAVSSATILSQREDRVHADLGAALKIQLVARGVERVEHLDLCTSCHPETLWSYRRSGQGAGRNLSFAWLSAE